MIKLERRFLCWGLCTLQHAIITLVHMVNGNDLLVFGWLMVCFDVVVDALA